MNRLLLIAIFIAAFGYGTASAAQDFDFSKVKKDGDAICEKLYDLDGDGAEEKISLLAYGLKKEGEEVISYGGQLVVSKKKKDSYEKIWEGPKYGEREIFEKNEFRFIFADFGLEPIEAIGDIDGDGAAELISPMAVSDVRPIVWRVYRFKGGKFEFVRSDSLLQAADGDGRYEWKKADEKEVSKTAWVNKFLKIEKGIGVEAEVWAYPGGAKVKGGKALIKSEKDGFNLVKWIEPMKELE